jgi:hypothetical protein
MTMFQAAADKSKAAKGGNPVYRELLHFHTAPIILLQPLGKVHSRLLSVDAEGHVAIWAYSPDLFESQGWFRPLHTTCLDLRYLSLSSIKVSPACPSPPQTPHPALEAMLQPMRRREEEQHQGKRKEGEGECKGQRVVLVETFQPVRGVPNHPPSLEVQYERRSTPPSPHSTDTTSPLSTDTPDTTDTPPDGTTITTTVIPQPTSSSSSSYKWSAINVRTTLLSAGVLDVQVTSDGDELVLLMTYEAVTDDGSGDENLALSELKRTETERDVEKAQQQQQREIKRSSARNKKKKKGQGKSKVAEDDAIEHEDDNDNDNDNEENDDDEAGKEEEQDDAGDEASLSRLDTVTDSEGEEEEDDDEGRESALFCAEKVERTVHRTAAHFSFWQRDKEQQRAGLVGLEATEERRREREQEGGHDYGHSERDKVLRRLSTVADSVEVGRMQLVK